MPYIGRELDRGNYLKLDDISSSFNNSLTTFNLTNGGKAFYPGSAFSILVVLAGVVQEPETAYQINQAQITFASAPLAGDQFFCIALGVALGVNTPANGSVNGTQLAKPFNYDGYFYLDDTNNRVGIATATPQKPLHVVGEGQFDSVRVLGDLTVEGTTSTLDTVVTEVDKLEVGANNNTVGVAITQSGSGHAAIFMGGNIGVGKANPGQLLTVGGITGGADGTLSVKTNSNKHAIAIEKNSGNENYQLGVNSDGDLGFYNSGSTIPTVTFSDDNRVGIGTDFPTRILHVSSSNDQYIRVTSTTSGNAGIEFGDAADKGKSNIVYANSDDSMFFTVNGSEKVRISSTGNVGIGTDDPQSQFEVYGTSPIVRSKHKTSQKYTQINHDGTDGYLDWSSGNLLLRGASNEVRLRIDANGDITTSSSVTIQTSNPFYENNKRILELNGGTQGWLALSATRTDTDAYVGGINFVNRHGQIDAHRFLGYIRLKSTHVNTGQYGTSVLKGQLEFATKSPVAGISTTTPDMVISPTGNVGINSTTPGHKLEVAYTSDDDGFVINHANRGGKWRFATSGSNAELFDVRRYDGANSTFRRYLLFGPDQFSVYTGSTTSATERLRIDSDGRLLAGGATSSNAWVGGDDLIIGNTTSGTRSGITLVSGSNTDGGLYWSDGNSGTSVLQGQLVYNHSNSRMQFYTAAAARVTIDSAGRLLIGRVTNLQSSAERLTVDSGMGIIRNNSTSTAALYLRNEDSTADTRHPYLIFTDGSGNRGGIGIQNDASSMWIHGQNGIAFRTSGTSPGSAERLKIHSSGATTMHVNNEDHDTFRFTTQGADEAKLIMRDASDNDDIVLNTGGDSWINSADFGIGTNSPGARLDILDGTSDGTVVRMRNEEVGIVYGVWGTGSSYPRETSINGTRFDNGTSPWLRLAGQGGIKFCADLNSEHMRIRSDGKIGINSTTPTARVDIDHPHTEQGLIVKSRYGNIADAMVKFDGDPAGNGGDGNILHIHGGSSRTDSEILHIDSTGVGDIFDIRGDGLTRVYKQLQLEHSSNVAKIIFNEYGANDTKAQIEMDQVNGSSGQLIFRTQQSGTLAERFRISSGGTLHYLGENQTVASGGGSAKKVLVTNAYEEWHFTWSGQSSKTATFTCSSYFHAEVIYTSHQTNGGSDIHRYIRGKWANNHTTHTWVQHEDVGNTWGLTSFSITAGQNGNNSASGKLTISETYNSGSVSTRAVIMRIYYGASSLGWDIA